MKRASLLLSLLLAGCGGGDFTPTDDPIGLLADTDGETAETSDLDAGTDTARPDDTGVPSDDTGTRPDTAIDTAVPPLDAPEVSPADTGISPDTAPIDTGALDTGPADTGSSDTGLLDTGSVDSGIDTGPADTGPVVKRIFTSSVAYLPNLGGLAGADAKCQGLATAAGLPGTYKAWLGSSTVSVKSRLAHPTVPYVLVDGTTVADSWTDLTSGALIHAIDKTEKGTTPPLDPKPASTRLAGPGPVWTSALENGGSYPVAGYDDACKDWSWKPSDGLPAHALIGEWSSASSTWSYGGGLNNCAIGSTPPTEVVAALYCLQQ